MHPSKAAQPSNPSGESDFPSTIDFTPTHLFLTPSTPGTTSQGPEHTRITAEQRADGHTILSELLFFFSFPFFFLFFGDVLGATLPIPTRLLEWGEADRLAVDRPPRSIAIDRINR